MRVQARLSADRKYVICGACKRALCRRDRRERPGGPAREDHGGHRVPGTKIAHVLAWEDGWHIVGDHMEMWTTADQRLAKGLKPNRHDWTDAGRFELTDARRNYWPAKCKVCPAINTFDPKRLDVDGIAPH